MTWRSFMQYAIMRELGQSDSIHRNYDLGNLNGSKPGIVLDRAYARMGFDQHNIQRAFVLPSIAQHMRNVGFTPPDPDTLACLAREWYNWDRIRAGELQQWPLRAVDNPLL